MPQLQLAALALCCLACAAAVGIRLQHDGRFTDVLVAISDDVSEDWDLVQRIKDSFSSASRQLDEATFYSGQSLAFGDVHILVPRSWNRSRSDAVATWETQDRSSFRVGQVGQSQPPDTVQPGGCGRPALYVTLHSQHLNTTPAEQVGKQLVHEFARLRWGVFREFNAAAGPHSHLRNGRIQPVACSRGISGRFAHKDTGNPCRVDRNTLQLEPDCRFVPNEQQTAAASLMFATFIPSVDRFCRNSNDDSVGHNEEAPSPHNRRCGGLSVTDVMRQHPDFRGVVNQTEVDPTVRFRVVRPPLDRNVVIVMDLSGSMRGQPLAKLKIAGRSLVLNLLEPGVSCSLIRFNETVEVLERLRQLSSAAVRQQFWETIRDMRAGGFTAIGDGLVAAMKQLGADTSNNGSNLSKSDTGFIVLLSDGRENRGSVSLPEASAMLRRTSIVVDTIAFGNLADKRLADLSRDTGGNSYFSSVSSGANDLLEALADMIRDRVSVLDKPIDIFSSPVAPGFSQNFAIDESITKDASFVLSSPRTGDISRAELQLRSPSGEIYDRRNGSFYEKDASNGIISISIPGNIEAGTWTIDDVGNSSVRRRRSVQSFNNPMTLVVSSKPSDQAPVILEGSVSDERVNLTADATVSVFARLQRGSQLLMDANISASVEADSGVEATFQLLDNGVGADVQAGDGVYSGTVPTSVQTLQEYNVRLLCTEPVARVSTAGKFEILSVDRNSLQRAPPATVEDLRAAIDLEASSVTLSWTGVGDRGMEGTPSHYMMFSCESPQQLRNISSSSSSGCSSWRLPTPPAAGGERMSATFSSEQLGSPSATVFLGVSGVSAAGVQAAASNPTSVQFRLPDNIGDFVVDGLSPVAIVFIVIGCLLVVALVAAAAVLLWRRRQSSS